MAAKDITIRIQAAGGDQAAQEIRKVEQAVKQADTSATTATRGFGGMLDNVPERADEAAQSIREVATATNDVAEASREAAQEIDAEVAAMREKEAAARKYAAELDQNQGGSIGQDVKGIAAVQRAQVVADLAAKIGEAGTRLRESAQDFKGLDDDLAGSLESTGTAIEKTTTAVGALALGFAAGGPLGASIAGVGFLFTEAVSALEDMAVALAKSENAQRTAASMQAQLAEATRVGAENYWAAAFASQNLEEATRAVTESIKDQVAALESRNRILAAEDRAKSAARDREDAARIAAGEAPEKVRADRARFDAEQETARLNREEEAKRSVVQEAFEAYKNAEFQAGKVRGDERATPEQIASADENVAKLKEQFERLQQQYQELAAINRARRVEVNERAQGRVEAAERQQRERTDRERTRAESTAGRDAERLIPREASDQLREAIQRVSRGLQDGDQGGELAQIIALLQQLANVVDKKDQGKQKEIDALKQRIANMEQQTKNNRK